MVRLFALLVGIDKYPNPAHRLFGCVNDAKAMKAYIETFSSSTANVSTKILLDSEATRAHVIEGFEDFLSKAAREDSVLFYYAGHGSQEPAPSRILGLGARRCG